MKANANHHAGAPTVNRVGTRGPDCKQCGRGTTRLSRQRSSRTERGTRSSAHIPTQYLECEPCGRIYVDAAGGPVEIQPIPLQPPAAPAAVASNALRDLIEYAELVAEELPPGSAAALQRKLQRVREQP